MRFYGPKKSIFIETVVRGQYWFFMSTKIIKTNDAIALLHNWQVRRIGVNMSFNQLPEI